MRRRDVGGGHGFRSGLSDGFRGLDRLAGREGEQVPAHLGNLLRVHVAERVLQAADGAGMELRHARFVDPDLGANLLHRRFAVVVHADHAPLAGRQRLDRRAHVVAHLGLLVSGVRRVGLRGDERRGQRAIVGVLTAGERRSRFDGVDADNGPAQALFVGSDAGGEVGQRGLASQLAAQRLAGGIELAALTADAARPGVAAQRIDHGAADAALRKGFELDSAILVEAVRGVDQAQDSVLHEITDVNRIRHRGGHAARERFNERKAGNDTTVLTGSNGLDAHLVSLSAEFRSRGCRRMRDIATAIPTAAAVFRHAPSYVRVTM